MLAVESSSEPVPETLSVSGHDDGSFVSAPPRGSDDGVAEAALASCTEPAGPQDSRRVGAPTADDVVDASALGWAPVKRPRTRKAVTADRSKPAPREDDGDCEGAARRPPGDAAAVVAGARATALERMETDTTTEQVAGGKLMADAIRVGNARASACFIDEMEAAMEKKNRDGGESSSAAAVSESKEAVAFFPGNAFVGDALRATLASLDASDLKSVHKKAMPGSDRRRNQNRLLISCKKKMAHNPFDNVLTPKEWPLVHRQEQDGGGAGEDKGKNKRKAGGKGKKKCGSREYKGKKRKKAGSDGDEESDTGENDQQEEEEKTKNTDPGLSVQAYDRDGRAYSVQLKYLTCNRGYRIIGTDWRVFLQTNGLLVGDGGTTRKRRNRSPGEEGGEESSPPDGEHLEQHEEVVPVAPPARSRRKRRKPSPGGACGEGTSGSPDGEHHPEQDADDRVHIEVWAFRSPKLPPGSAEEGFSPDHEHGALGLLLLHHRDSEAAQAVAGGARPTPEEVKGAAPDEATEQPRQNAHGGAATQDEGVGAREVMTVADCAGDASTVVAAGAPGGEPGDAAARSSREPRLTPLEMLIALWLVSLKFIYGEGNRNDKKSAPDR